LEESNKYDLTDYEAINGKADIVAYLVAHKEFKGFKTERVELDFCGVKK
jgi:UDP-N-acetyl-D-mannosaminuronic acid dehydrogenase